MELHCQLLMAFILPTATTTTKHNNNNKPPSLQAVSDFQVSGCSSLDQALGSDPAADLQQAKGGTKQLLQPAKAVLTCTYPGGALTHGSIRCKIKPFNKIKCAFLFLRFWNEINEISDLKSLGNPTVGVPG